MSFRILFRANKLHISPPLVPFLFVVLFFVGLSTNRLMAEEPEPAQEKAKGPEHNVTLAEEPGVVDLLSRAKKARERADKDPEVWPECLKFYADILRKYPNSVYLDRWEGPDKSDMAFKNGLYKSTRERVASDLASLPAAGLSSYRVINDPPARVLFHEAQEQFDERKMEQTAQDFFASSFGDDALAWLGEVSYDRGEPRQAIARLDRVAKHPSPDIRRLGLLVRGIMACLRLADGEGARKRLAEIKEAMQDPKNGTLRAGHDEGQAAFDKLSQRVATLAVVAVGLDKDGRGNRSWETYFGNAAHTAALPSRQTVGLLKWSQPVNQLLYGPNADADVGKINTVENGQIDDPTIKWHLTIKDDFFYMCDGNVTACYPVSNPKPGAPSAGGDAKFFWPADIDEPRKASSMRSRRGNIQMNVVSPGVRQQPYFCTLFNDRLYAVLGGDALTTDPNMAMWQGMEANKQKPNYMAALERRSGKRVWALEAQPESPEFKNCTKADQDWLKSIYFVSAPTYESGMLYNLAVQMGGMHEAWVVAFDANTGHLQWRTQICSANPVMVAGAVQPHVGLPVAVANGTVYAVTNLGAVAAVDALSGNIKWIRIYDRLQSTVNRMAQGNVRLPNDFWAPNPPIVYDNLLIATPQDSDMLYAYDIETGRRIYEAPRTVKWEKGGEDQLKHILGLLNGNLVVSGTSVHFYELKSGKIVGHYLPDSPVKGRGLVAGNMVLVPTERALLTLDGHLIQGEPTLKELYKWADPKVEKYGNLCLAGDMLYVVTPQYVNAYFVWQELEAKLKESLGKEPGDLSLYCDLADIYLRIERFDEALATLDKGLAIADKNKTEPKNAAIAINLRSRKFDAYFALGEHAQIEKGADLNAAYAYFEKASIAAATSDLPAEKSVVALRAMAENAVARKDWATAVQHYQRMIADFGDVVYAFASRSSSKTRLHAQARIEEIKNKNPASYEKIESEAKGALAKAASDPKQLEALLAQYPNSEASASALMLLAQLTLVQNPDQAGQYLQNYLNRFRASADAPSAMALLATALERSKMLGQARETLQRLATAPEFADKTALLDLLDPKNKPAEPLNLSQWAKKRLEEPQFKGSPSSATCSLGNGKLIKAWIKTTGEHSVPLLVHGNTPFPQRQRLFFVENQTELSVLGAVDGKEAWTPRPKLPANAIYALWADRLLIVCGGKELVAYDSLENGKLVWRQDLRTAAHSGSCWVQFSHGRVVVSSAAGVSVLDAATGNELWSAQVEGTPLPGNPGIGDGFVAVAAQNPAKIFLYDIDTGARRAVLEGASGEFAHAFVNPQAQVQFQVQIIGGQMQQIQQAGATPIFVAPVVAGDRVYAAERNNKISAFDGRTGKLIWEQQMDGQVTKLCGSREVVFAVINQKQVVALKTETNAGGGFRAVMAGKIDEGDVRDIYFDGDDLFVGVNTPGVQPKLRCYSIQRGCKFCWDVDISPDSVSPAMMETISTLMLGAHYTATNHLVLAEGSMAWSLVLVERKTGKRVWDEKLESEPKQIDAEGLLRSTFSVQMFDGGLVINESRRMRAYVLPELMGVDAEDLQSLQNKLAKNPNDVNLRVKLAKLQYAAGESEKALQALGAVLADPKLEEQQFSSIYADFSRLRNDTAEKKKRVLAFTKVEQAPKLNGSLEGWQTVPETVFDKWQDVYLATEQDERAGAKASQWKGASDLKVSFRGAYDAKNLYLSFVVADDKHNNPAIEGNDVDLGDCVKLAFDISEIGGRAPQGESFILDMGVNNNGTVLAWRRMEHHKYLTGSTPLETGAFAVRKEAEKQTVYQLALPLEYLTLKPEAGKTFGFSFAVHDRDEGENVEKSIGPSPGAWGQVFPRRFTQGVLQGKQ